MSSEPRELGAPQTEIREPRWLEVLDQGGQVLDWVCPACERLLHLPNSGRAKCCCCGMIAGEEYHPKQPQTRSRRGWDDFEGYILPLAKMEHKIPEPEKKEKPPKK